MTYDLNMEHPCKILHFDSLAKCKEIVVYIIARFIALGKRKNLLLLRRDVTR